MSSRQTSKKVGAAVALFGLMLISACTRGADKSLSLFKYTASLNLPSLESNSLIEIELSEHLLDASRDDFADLRIIRNSNQGVLPVIVGPKTTASNSRQSLVQREFSAIDIVPDEIANRYVGSSFIVLETACVPLSKIALKPLTDRPNSGYMLLGSGATHAAGAEWMLLARGMFSEKKFNEANPATFAVEFKESRCRHYVFVFDNASYAATCAVRSVYGTDYRLWFEAHPGEGYTLLCGYPEGSTATVYNAAKLEKLIAQSADIFKIQDVALQQNPQWNAHSLKGLAFERSFVIPLASVALVAVVMIVFVIVFAILNRRPRFKIQNHPRFFRDRR